MMIQYDKDKIKNELEIDQIEELLNELGAEPINKGNHLVCKTICHNCGGQGSHKLYYYDNTKLFKCFTDCSETFDCFSLVQKVMKSTIHVDWELPQCVKFVADYYKINPTSQDNFENRSRLGDWKVFDNYKSKLDKPSAKIVEMPNYDGKILEHLPQPIIKPWEDEGIAREVINLNGIKYNPLSEAIVIPHYDINNNLVGIRERTLIKENEKYGKYRPAVFQGKMYNHPLGFNLYGIDKAAAAIKVLKKAIIFEGKR